MKSTLLCSMAILVYYPSLQGGHAPLHPDGSLVKSDFCKEMSKFCSIMVNGSIFYSLSLHNFLRKIHKLHIYLRTNFENRQIWIDYIIGRDLKENFHFLDQVICDTKKILMTTYLQNWSKQVGAGLTDIF